MKELSSLYKDTRISVPFISFFFSYILSQSFAFHSEEFSHDKSFHFFLPNIYIAFFSTRMKTFIIVFVSVFVLLNQINSVISKKKSTGIISKEPLEDYDVKKKVILTPVSKDFYLFSLSYIVVHPV
jgi:2-iminobutanoate/2-iminopropanoate deaminase